jgi:hypothetical protein
MVLAHGFRWQHMVFGYFILILESVAPSMHFLVFLRVLTFY